MNDTTIFSRPSARFCSIYSFQRRHDRKRTIIIKPTHARSPSGKRQNNKVVPFVHRIDHPQSACAAFLWRKNISTLVLDELKESTNLVVLEIRGNSIYTHRPDLNVSIESSLLNRARVSSNVYSFR